MCVTVYHKLRVDEKTDVIVYIDIKLWVG